jgi:hypothetical protein
MAEAINFKTGKIVCESLFQLWQMTRFGSRSQKPLFHCREMRRGSLFDLDGACECWTTLSRLPVNPGECRNCAMLEVIGDK